MAEPHTVVDILKERAERHGESSSFVFRSEDNGRYELSWSSLYQLSGRFAAILRDAGIGRGHLVVNTLVNSPERAVSDVALWMSGAASVNGHCQLADGSDLLHIVRTSRASAMLVDPDANNSPWQVIRKLVTLDENNNVTSSALTDLKKLFFVRRTEKSSQDDFLSWLEAQREWFQADILPEDTMNVFTTSGSTGFSKLVVYTHGDIMQLNEMRNTDIASKVIFNMAPLGWLGGYFGSMLTSCGTNINCDVRASGYPDDVPQFIWKSIQEEKCNWANVSPVYISAIAKLANARHDNLASTGELQAPPVRKLDVILLGGQPVTRTMVEDALTSAHSVIVDYGSTDIASVTFLHVTDSKSYVDHDTGPPMKDTTVKIVSKGDEDRVLEANQLGSILVKGRKKNHGFLSDDTSVVNNAYTKDGYYRTKDIGRLDERGHLIVEGREGDAIMRGPYIFYPSWIESRIGAIPGVLDVIVIGVHDPSLHEELCACVVLDGKEITLEQVRHFVEKDVLTSDKDPMSPRPRHYLEFESFPVTTTDKPSRKVIKSLAEDRLHMSSEKAVID